MISPTGPPSVGTLPPPRRRQPMSTTRIPLRRSSGPAGREACAAVRVVGGCGTLDDVSAHDPRDPLADKYGQMSALEKIEWMIETDGYAVEPVPPEPDWDPPRAGYTYTIGFTAHT